MNNNNHIDDILDVVKNIIEITSSEEWDNKHDTLKYMADNYRIEVDNSKELFCSELPEYVGFYSLVQNYTSIVKIAENTGLQTYLVRNILKEYRDMAYLTGYKINNDFYKTVDSRGRVDYTEELFKDCNSKIESREYTTQQVFAALKLCHIGYEVTNRGEYDMKDYLSLLESISQEISKMYNRYEPSEEMEWNKFGGSLDFMFNDIHHKIIKEMAKNKVIREIKNGERSI